MQTRYPDVKLFIDGTWRDGSRGETIEIFNPATDEVIGHIARATTADLDDALAAVDRGFEAWSKVSAFDRYKIMRRAADIFRSRGEEVARLLTMEQGKPLAEARIEAAAACDLIDWFAEEARRSYGRIVPPRQAYVMQAEVKEPVGPVAAFTPWNFPINQAVRKISAALAAGCSILLKAAEDTPAAPAELVRAFAEAGLPDGAINLVYGDPAEISAYLIPHPVIRKVSFTGSTQVGKQLAALAGLHMKRVTMELGGHAPVIIAADADVEQAIKVVSGSKFRNAGQVCISPTRFLIENSVYDQVVEGMAAYATSLKVGDGLEAGTTMGPLVNAKRVNAMERLVQDAREHKARVVTGGERIGNRGNFFRANHPCRCAEGCRHHERGAVRPGSAVEQVRCAGRGTERSQSPELWSGGLCLHRIVGEGCPDIVHGSQRNDHHQSLRSGPAGSALRRDQRFRLWNGRRCRRA
ncbi:6-oxohexanoate dehydrogenase [Brucella abortus S19]|uniref:6-oxohexanoate dehydrogenase n=1 Tax=Brucella abortus (strain S19) TaxID=430066 RepID=A0A0F6AVQ0_BRUA1|nr:6-oxohexanoate dehydrogenase [Brucella abortus S19]